MEEEEEEEEEEEDYSVEQNLRTCGFFRCLSCNKAKSVVSSGRGEGLFVALSVGYI
jgi:hypothetical protein